jgi:hypothetical protein
MGLVDGRRPGSSVGLVEVRGSVVRYNRNPLLMTVLNPGRRYQGNPHILIDSGDDRILGVERGDPIKTFDRAYAKAKVLAARIGRKVHIVAHMGVPPWMKKGAQVSKLFYFMGPYVSVTPSGQWVETKNPRSRVRRNPSFGASMMGSLAGGLIANALTNPGRRSQKSAEKALDHAIGVAWARHMSGVQVSVMEIPRIFRDIKLEIASGAPLEQAVISVGSRYRVNPLSASETQEMIDRSHMADQRAKSAQRMGDPRSELYYRARRDEAEYVVGGYGARVRYNPGPRGQRRITMTIEKFANWVRAKRDPAMWKAFLAKFRGYENWTHGAKSRKVTLEWQNVPGIHGLWITYDGGKQPESTYIMPDGSPRKGAWKHKWDTMPEIKHDPQARVTLTKLRGKSKITDFYHH